MPDMGLTYDEKDPYVRMYQPTYDRVCKVDEHYPFVDNSLKYRREKGEIEIIAMRQGEDVLVRVLDSGIGISNEDLPHIFDKFYRAEKSRSSSIPGSGLGLSICKYIVETNHNKTTTNAYAIFGDSHNSPQYIKFI